MVRDQPAWICLLNQPGSINPVDQLVGLSASVI
jgi:hypothetical protein